MGIPTISVYRGELLAVDRYLLEQGCMTHRQGLSVEDVDSFLESAEGRPPNKELLRKGAAAAELIRRLLLNEA
jgi:uncharacterized protein